MSLLQINTAVPLAQPLLEQQTQVDDGRKNIDDEKQNGNNSSSSWSRTKCTFCGLLTGFVIQIISLGAYALLLMDNNSSNKNNAIDAEIEIPGASPTSLQDHYREAFLQQANHSLDSATTAAPYLGKDAFVFTILSILTQIDLVVYVVVWLAFSCTMTRSGMACIRSQFFAKSKSAGGNALRRHVFVLGVFFLVGIVLGAFGAWTAVDVVLDFPIPFEPILLTVAVDLGLCYMMICCFDLGGNAKNNHGEDEDDEEDEVEFC